MNRRSFLENICKTGAGIVIGGSLIDLTSIPSIKAHSRAAQSDNREIPLNLIDTPELKPIGGIYHLSVEDLEREILVAHVAPDQFVAVDIKCTHRGCDLNYDSNGKKFVCPCHGSEFDLSGVVTKGPASRPLNHYSAVLKDDEVIVTVYGLGDMPPASPTPMPDTMNRVDSADSVIVRDTTHSVGQ
jgi:Rieske Fe-S protein